MTAAAASPLSVTEPTAAGHRIALLGNPNTGKTTLFNRLTGLRHKTANFPGTTLEARIGQVDLPDESGPAHVIDLPGVYSLELDQLEAEVCRAVLEGRAAPRGEPIAAPTGVCIVADATNLPRNLMLVGEAARRRLPTVVAVNMIDLALKRGVTIDAPALEALLGCSVVCISARDGNGIEALEAALSSARIPNHTPPGTQEGLRTWADDLVARTLRGDADLASESFTDRIDRVTTHPLLGLITFVAIMAALFWMLFSLAQVPMALLETVFTWVSGTVKAFMPAGFLADFLADGVIGGVGATVVFLPQICLLFFFISILEDTGYLARAAFVMDRALRPFGLPGHAFMPLLSSHACALPGIMSARAIPDRRERLATILVAPFMTCSARLPVYVLVTTVLFRDDAWKASLAFIGCYALGILAGVLSALLARRTILRGPSRPMALELPTYKRPSLRTAAISTYDRAIVFLKKAGTNILAICIVLWWLGAYPIAKPPERAEQLRAEAAAAVQDQPERAAELESEADRLTVMHQSASSFAGRLGRLAQPVFAPLGYDWQLTVGVITSFAAREVFVSTMAVVVAGQSEEDEGVMDAIAAAKRDDGTPIFTTAVCWSLLVYYVLAMQCLPTLAVTAREAGSVKWALLQLVWMCGVAYIAAMAVYQVLS
jgi:ferrous iron transport protein B